jgi:hypothetical protein
MAENRAADDVGKLVLDKAGPNRQRIGWHFADANLGYCNP